MPTYEYVCEKCGHRFEKFQPITAPPLTACPKDLCARQPWGKGKVKRQIGAGAGLIFKGNGFYITDYRSEKYKEAAKKDVPPAAASSSTEKPAASAGGKPAAKPAGKSASKATARN